MNKRKFNKGRPLTLNQRDKRKVIRTLHKLRREQASFSSEKIDERAGLSQHASHRCVRRTLRQHGYKYLQSRKKGLLTQKDYARFAVQVCK